MRVLEKPAHSVAVGNWVPLATVPDMWFGKGESGGGEGLAALARSLLSILQHE